MKCAKEDGWEDMEHLPVIRSIVSVPQFSMKLVLVAWAGLCSSATITTGNTATSDKDSCQVEQDVNTAQSTPEFSEKIHGHAKKSDVVQDRNCYHQDNVHNAHISWRAEVSTASKSFAKPTNSWELMANVRSAHQDKNQPLIERAVLILLARTTSLRPLMENVSDAQITQS